MTQLDGPWNDFDGLAKAGQFLLDESEFGLHTDLDDEADKVLDGDS